MKRIEPTQPASSEPLSKKVIKGGIWIFALRIANRSLGLIRTIVLARLLAPSDFGLFGIAALAISAIETFSQTGFQAALIQKKGDVAPYLDTTWTVSAIRGIILFLILYGAAPIVGRFFNSSQATLVIKVISISTLFTGFRNIGITFFQKELEFNKQFQYELSGTLADLTVAIFLAIILRNVWALVWGALAAHCVRLIMSYALQSYRPRIRIETRQFKELFSFGKWVFGSSILVFLVVQGDDIFVGKTLGVTALGFYQMAYLISNMPYTEITSVISKVTFPAYSKRQDDLQKLKEAYLKVLQLVAFIVIPLAGGISVLAPEFTEILLGDKWLPMVQAMQVLVFAGLVRSIGGINGSIFRATGRPDIDTRWQMVRLCVLAALIYPLSVKWGLVGASVAVFLSILASATGFSFMGMKITGCGVREFGKRIILPLMSAMVMIAYISILKRCIHVVSVWEFLMCVGLGGLVYLGMIYLLDRFLDYGMREIIRESLVSLRGKESERNTVFLG